MAKKEDHERITGKKEWQKEPWYGTEFRVENFDEEFVKLVCFVHEGTHDIWY